MLWVLGTSAIYAPPASSQAAETPELEAAVNLPDEMRGPASGKIADPRPAGFVVDRAGVLTEAEAARINELAAMVTEQGRGELAVVVVQTVGAIEPRAFGTELMNAWGLGEASGDRGLLLLLGVDDREAEIVLGNGVDSDPEVEMAQQIMSQVMVPRFIDGEMGAALLAGAEACASQILGYVPPGVVEAPSGTAGFQGLANSANPPPLTKKRRPSPPAHAAPSAGPSIKTFIALGLLCLLCLLCLLALLVSRSRRAKQAPRIYRPRCEACDDLMTALGRRQGEERLEPHELLEEKLNSVTYCFYSCPKCQQVAKRRSVVHGSGYADCKACGVRAAQTKTTRLQDATFEMGGALEITRTCQGCGHVEAKRTNTPPLVRAKSPSEVEGDAFDQDSASSLFGWSQGSSSSSGAGGRSSSRTSSGSGSSSGRGASGKW